MFRLSLALYRAPNGLLLVALLAVFACGGSDRTPEADDTVTADPNALQICELLTDDEVSTVLPGHDGGMVASSGGSLVDGIDTYQCSYTAFRDGDPGLMTVIVSVAASEELFETIKPNASMHRDFGGFREVEIAGGGGFVWLQPPGDLTVTAWKGWSEIELQLMVDESETHADALHALTSVVAAKIN